MNCYPKTSHIAFLLAQRLSQIEWDDEQKKWQGIVRSLESFIDPAGYQATYEKQKEEVNKKVTVRPDDEGKTLDDVEDLDAKVRELVAKGLKTAIDSQTN